MGSGFEPKYPEAEMDQQAGFNVIFTCRKINHPFMFTLKINRQQISLII